MLYEAELFVFAEQVLLEVLGRIRPEDRGIVVPSIPDLPGAEGSLALGELLGVFVRDEAAVPPALAGRTPNDDVDDLPAEPADRIVGLMADASAAAQDADDPDRPVQTLGGGLTVRQYLLRLAVSRSLLAHYVASYLGSTACPLPEELARPLWELTAPDAAAWRELGVFRDPLPIPELASWRDVFLRTAGHEPHPLGH